MKTHNLQKRTAGILVATILCFGAMPAVAGAQGDNGSINVGPTSAQYDPANISFGDRANDPNDPSANSGLNESVGPLPFTGFDVIAMLAVALAVTGLGLALQRAVSREPRELR